MTITATTAKSGPYNGNGSTAAFDYDFLILDEADIVVTLTSSAGVETVQTITTHYTVSGVGSASGGVVTMVTAPAVGEKLTLTRSTDLTQEVDLENRGAVVPEVLEDALDKLTIALQDINEKISRAVLSGVSEDEPATYSDFLAIQAAVEAAQAAAEAAQAAAEAAQSGAEAAENSLLEWAGAWTTATAYAPSDIVRQDGSAYVCLVAHTSGTFSSDLSAARWELFAQKGDAGAGTGDMLAANNLSDVADADTALANLGGGSTGIAIFKDTTPAAVRTELGLGSLATLSSITTSQIASGTLVTEAEGLASSDNDTSLPTVAAVVDHVATELATAVAALPPSGSVLLGTMTTTSGSSWSITSLDLTGYKFVRCVIDGVSASSTASLMRFATNVRICTPSPTDTSQVSYGVFDIDLSDGTFAACVVPMNGGTPGSPTTGGGNSGVTTASTSIGVNFSTATGDAGSIRFYGVP